MKSQLKKILDAARRGKVGGSRALKQRHGKRRAGKLRHGSGLAASLLAAPADSLDWQAGAALTDSERDVADIALLMQERALDEANEPGEPNYAEERSTADMERGDEAEVLVPLERQRNRDSEIDARSETPGAAGGI